MVSDIQKGLKHRERSNRKRMASNIEKDLKQGKGFKQEMVSKRNVSHKENKASNQREWSQIKKNMKV